MMRVSQSHRKIFEETCNMRAQQQLTKSLTKQSSERTLATFVLVHLRQLCSQIGWKTKLELIRISNVAGT